MARVTAIVHAEGSKALNGSLDSGMYRKYPESHHWKRGVNPVTVPYCSLHPLETVDQWLTLMKYCPDPGNIAKIPCKKDHLLIAANDMLHVYYLNSSHGYRAPVGVPKEMHQSLNAARSASFWAYQRSHASWRTLTVLRTDGNPCKSNKGASFDMVYWSDYIHIGKYPNIFFCWLCFGCSSVPAPPLACASAALTSSLAFNAMISGGEGILWAGKKCWFSLKGNGQTCVSNGFINCRIRKNVAPPVCETNTVSASDLSAQALWFLNQTLAHDRIHPKPDIGASIWNPEKCRLN